MISKQSAIMFFLAFFKAIFISIVLHASVHAEGSKLDALFTQLQNAENEADAQAIEEKIWFAWMESGDAEIDTLMREAMRERRSYNFDKAIKILNKIIQQKPNFAEAWNQRATLYFYQKKYEESLIDIAKTLELEPRHFGSLAGRAVIRWQQSKPELARQNIIEAMKVHPFLKEQNMFPGLKKS